MFGIFSLGVAALMVPMAQEAVRYSAPAETLSFEAAAAKLNGGKLQVNLTGLEWQCSQVWVSGDCETVPLVSGGNKLVVMTRRIILRPANRLRLLRPAECSIR